MRPTLCENNFFTTRPFRLRGRDPFHHASPRRLQRIREFIRIRSVGRRGEHSHRSEHNMVTLAKILSRHSALRPPSVLRKGLQDRVAGSVLQRFVQTEYHKGDMTSVVFRLPSDPGGGKGPPFQILQAGIWRRGRSAILSKSRTVPNPLVVPEPPRGEWDFQPRDGAGPDMERSHRRGHAALSRPTAIDYIEMPKVLREQYQYFTEAADGPKLRAAGCPMTFSRWRTRSGITSRIILLKADPYL